MFPRLVTEGMHLARNILISYATRSDIMALQIATQFGFWAPPLACSFEFSKRKAYQPHAKGATVLTAVEKLDV